MTPRAGLTKAVTFSFDDGVRQDIRLIEMFDRYGLKSTFNINSAFLGNVDTSGRKDSRSKVKAEEIRKVYRNHEVAAHAFTHPYLTELSDEELLYQVAVDQKILSALCGYDVIGMAYPGGGEKNHNQYVADFISKNTTIKYARTITSTHNFDLQDDLIQFNPTVYIQEADKMFELANEFIELKTDTPKIFYVWGHSYEYDLNDTWGKMEEFCKLISGHDDMFYGTNREVLLGEGF